MTYKGYKFQSLIFMHHNSLILNVPVNNEKLLFPWLRIDIIFNISIVYENRLLKSWIIKSRYKLISHCF